MDNLEINNTYAVDLSILTIQSPHRNRNRARDGTASWFIRGTGKERTALHCLVRFLFPGNPLKYGDVSYSKGCIILEPFMHGKRSKQQMAKVLERV